MTPVAQRIAIAEACPNVARILGGVGNQPTLCVWLNKRRLVEFDPLNDLNAMHEAEKVLTREQMFRYALILRDEILDLGDDWITYTMAQVLHATAAQRAEAFLRTLDLWKE